MIFAEDIEIESLTEFEKQLVHTYRTGRPPQNEAEAEALRDAGVREVAEKSFYDTLVAPGLPFVPDTDLFGSRNVGFRRWSNMQFGGALAYDQHFEIQRVLVRTWAQADLFGGTFADAFLDELESNLIFQLVVGERGYGEYPLVPAQRLNVSKADEPPNRRFLSGARIYEWQLSKTVRVPARQSLGMRLVDDTNTVEPEAVADIIEGFAGKKLIQVWLAGVVQRDVI